MCGVAVDTDDFHKFAVLVKRCKSKVLGFRGFGFGGLGLRRGHFAPTIFNGDGSNHDSHNL